VDSQQTLQGLHQTIGLKVGTALSAVLLLAAAAPFCDPALSIIVEDLRLAMNAAQRARAIGEQLGLLVTGERGWPES
jgi:hypothetical protein